MVDDEARALWRNLVGDSEDDSDSSFHGFELREVVKGDESDIDLDAVVGQQTLRELDADFSDTSSSSESVSSDSDGLAVVRPPKKRKRIPKRQKRRQKVDDCSYCNCFLGLVCDILSSISA